MALAATNDLRVMRCGDVTSGDYDITVWYARAMKTPCNTPFKFMKARSIWQAFGKARKDHLEPPGNAGKGR
jgi:hypothetical protein